MGFYQKNVRIAVWFYGDAWVNFVNQETLPVEERSTVQFHDSNEVTSPTFDKMARLGG